MIAPDEKIRWYACPLICFIASGKTGACDRDANDAGRIVRKDPMVMLSHIVAAGGRIVPFAQRDWDGGLIPRMPFSSE